METWKAIVVDEFQDTSSMQYCLLRILASHKHVTIVGDEDQVSFNFDGYLTVFLGGFLDVFSKKNKIIP